jgi:pimeloyl-ACP methyl ester carboxylesterase
MTGEPPVVVLVHGGTFTSTMWDAVRSHMKTPSMAVDLPGRRYKPADLAEVSREDWVSSVCDDIAAAGLSDVVLVGHSSGGYVIPGVATGLGRLPGVSLHALVFVASTVPAEGTRPVDYLRDDLRVLAIDHREAVFDGARGRTLGGLRGSEAPIDTVLEIVENGPRMGLEAPGPLLAEFSWAGFPSEVPRFFVRCLKDKVIPPDLADTMIANMGGATVVDLEAGHRAFDTHPEELASIIDHIAWTG